MTGCRPRLFICRLPGWLILVETDVRMYKCLGVQTLGWIGIRVYRLLVAGYMNVRVYRCPNVQMSKCKDVQMYRCSDVQISGNKDVQLYRYVQQRCSTNISEKHKGFVDLFYDFWIQKSHHFYGFWIQNFFLSISTISGSRNCIIFAVSGSRYCTIYTISGGPMDHGGMSA